MGAIAQVRLGIIGTGLAIEKLHWPALVQLPEHFPIAAFANHSRPKAEAFAQMAGVGMDNYHADYADLLRRDDVDAVLIALPIPLLYPATRDALRAGKHVLVEKPAGADRAQADAFLALEAEFPRLKVLVGENLFYRDDLLYARSVVEGGTIGRVHQMTHRVFMQSVPSAGGYSGTAWRQTAHYRGGPHLDGGVHHIAQIRMLMGEIAVVHAFAQSANPTMGGPSDLVVNLRFANDAIGTYAAGYPAVPTRDEPNEMRIYGTDGILALKGRTVRVFRADGTADERTIDNDGGYYKQLLNFHAAIVDDAPIVGTIAQSVANLQVIMAALDSAEQGQMVDLPQGEPRA